MTDIDPLKDPPLYEREQVITNDDLARLRQGFVVLLAESMKCCKDCQFQGLLSIGIIDSLNNWLASGKPPYLKNRFNSDTGRFDETH